MAGDLTRVQKIGLAVAVFGIFLSAFMLFKTAREYKLAENEYETLDRFAQKTETVTLTTTSLAPVEIEEEVEEELARNYDRSAFPDLEIDFDGLAEINDQIVAWLYVGSVGISYPVVQVLSSSYL